MAQSQQQQHGQKSAFMQPQTSYQPMGKAVPGAASNSQQLTAIRGNMVACQCQWHFSTKVKHTDLCRAWFMLRACAGFKSVRDVNAMNVCFKD
jgi:hypothetical protein